MSAAAFISHSSKDRNIAQAICAALEQRGLACWISSRDVQPGENFQEAIVRAIRQARTMVLVFSSNANNSAEIKKELALASQHGLVVVPVRVEDVAPNDAFAYEFATRQWIDLFHNFEQAIERLAAQIGGLMAPPRPVPAPTPPARVRPRWLWLAALGALAFVGAGAAFYVVSTAAPGPLSVAQERTLKVKDTFRECTNCPEMIVVPAGSFTMGSDAEPQTSPPHQVTFAHPFAVGRFALTFDEWDACVAEGGCRYKAYDREWGAAACR